MKVVLPKETKNGDKKKFLPPLPLVDDESPELDAHRSSKFKLRTEPTQDTSPTYDFHMVKLDGTESLRVALRFTRDILKVFAGLNITTDAAKHRLYEEMLTSEALNQYKSGVTKSQDLAFETQRNQAYDNQISAGRDAAVAQAAFDAVGVPAIDWNMITDGMKQVVTYMSPHKVLTYQKRWLRRFCRKPAGMPIRTFANHVTRINNDELPMLPPFHGTAQRLSNDEIVDIVLNGIPRSWLKEMDKLGFDPIEYELTQVIEFCERMESAEDFEPARDGGKTSSKDNKVPRKDSSSKKSKTEGGKYCLLHGNNGSHDTNDCMVLKNQAKALRNNDGDRKPAHENKTWKRDADKSTNSSKKELAAFVRKQARKELYAFAKKRKASDDDDDKSVNAMEEGELDFSKLNFGNMDELKSDSSNSDDEDMNGDDISV
jgi:hypothetical protein